MPVSLSPRRWLLVAFALSGCSGLIYESLWTHYLKLFLGHAAYAQTLVLAIFMGGMAVGAWLSSRRSTRWTRLLRAYALAEGAVGLAALLFHAIFTVLVGWAFRDVIPALPSPAAVTAFKWTLGGALILPQSVLLGMTFPLMAGGFIRAFPDSPGRSLATLYFCNSIGGVAGVLASGFLLIPWVGLAWTGALAGVLNLIIATLVLRIDPTVTGVVQAPAAGPVRNVALYRLLLGTALLTGAASFIYEVGWIRMLSLVLGSSTHAFELMLSAFILGLACGGLWIRRDADRLPNPIRFLGYVQVLMGLCAIGTLPVYGQTFSLVAWLVNALPKTDMGYLAFNVASHGVALAVMLPATFLAGTTLPLITLALVRFERGETSIGAVYGANTIGAIVGVAFAVHVGMPILGLKWLLMTGAALDIAVGLWLLWRHREGARQMLLVTAAVFVAVGVAGGGVTLDSRLMATGVFRPNQAPLTRDQFVLFERHGKTATVAVTETEAVVQIRTNGKIDASVNMGTGFHTPDDVTQVLSAALPLLLRPDARRAANIGLGSGVTSHVLLADTDLESVDTIEIESAMVEGAQWFRPRNERVFTDPRSRIVVDDAKTFFASQRRSYDVIVSEPSNPWVSGTASLFTQEFYALVRGHLAPNGLFVQWLQLYEFDLDLVASVLKALGQQFGDYAIYAPTRGDLVIVAVNGSRLPALGDEPWPSRLRDELRRVSIRAAEDIRRRKVANRQILEPWARRTAVRANSDYHPVLDHGAARARFLNRNAYPLIALGSGQLPILELIGGESRGVSPTRAEPTPYFPASPQPFLAMEIRAQLLGPPLGFPWPSNIPSPTDLAAGMILRCREGREAGREAALVELGLNVSAYLSPQELMEVWSIVEALPCAATPRGSGTGWLQLFRAVARRDPGDMAAAAKELLASGSLTGEQRAYAVQAGALGYVAGGRLDDARRLLESLQGSPVADQGLVSLLVLMAHTSP